MMDFMLEYKWFFLIGAEVSFWVLSCAFLVLRYLFDLNKASFVILGLIVLDNLFIAGLSLLDYTRTGEFSTYQSIAVAIIIYGLTFGKRDFKRLDAYLKRKVMRWKHRAPLPEDSPRKTAQEKATQIARDEARRHSRTSIPESDHLRPRERGEKPDGR